MAINNYPGFDYPEWEVLGLPIAAASSSANNSNGTCISEDYRNNDYAHPLFYFLNSNTSMRQYNHKMCAWQEVSTSTGLVGAVGTGATTKFIPSWSPSGTLAAGGSTTTVILSTALSSSVLANQLANRGDGLGFIIRITGKSAGGSGKTEERRVIANTAGTTPTLELDSPLSFTPASGDGYEFLSGSYIMINPSSTASGTFRRYDVLLGTFTTLSTSSPFASLPASGNTFICFDPSYVPNNRKTGEGQVVGAGTYNGGLLGCLTATATAAGTITGETSIGDYLFPANTFRNYQIRIVEDTTTPTAVGQIRKISSHTSPGGGAGAVYTLQSNWTVTPSSTCKFVIEHYGNNIMLLAGGTTTVYNYNIASIGGATADTWDTTTWAARGSSAQQTGAFSELIFGVVPNKIGSLKSSNIFCTRGNSASVDVFDISGASTGSWTTGQSIIDMTSNGLEIFGSGDLPHMAYNPHSQDGKYIYFCPGANNSITTANRPFGRIDTTNFKYSKFAGPKTITGTVAPATGKTAFVTLAYRGTDKVVSYVTPRPMTASGTPDYWRCLLTF